MEANARAMGGDLAALVSGEVVIAGSPGLAAGVTGWDLAVTHRPQVLVRAAVPGDLDATVGWAARHGVPVGVQCTGHGAVRAQHGGILLDTSALNGVRLDVGARTATVAAGGRWSDVIGPLADAGLSGLQGSSSGVGVAGYTLAGGMGPVARTFGFAADWVRELDVVLGTGERVTASAAENTELFWALRGGGGNLGVARSITFDLLELTTIYGGALSFDAVDAPAVLAAWRSWLAEIDDRTSTSLAFLLMPDVPALPPELRGRRLVDVRVAHVPGDRPGRTGHHDAALQEAGEGLVAPLRACARPVSDRLGVMRLRDSDTIHRDPVAPTATCHRSRLVGDLDDGFAEALLGVVSGPAHGGLRVLELRAMGGALARPAAVPNAVTGRSAGVNVYASAPQTGDPSAAEAIARCAGALAPWESATAQLNFQGQLGSPAAVLACWDPASAARLLRVKADADPADILTEGQAIRARGDEPTGGEPSLEVPESTNP